jgi:hypothetical protein
MGANAIRPCSLVIGGMAVMLRLSTKTVFSRKLSICLKVNERNGEKGFLIDFLQFGYATLELNEAF